MPQIIPTAQRVLQVFEVYARERRPLTNSEMARMLDLADSSCSDLLYTLRQAGYLLRTPKSRYFHPTGRLLDVAQGIAAADPLQAFAGEALEILTRQSGESSMCGLLDGNKVKIYASQESPRARYVVQPGTTFALHVAALGKALLGEMGEAERNALIDTMQFEHVTASSIADAATLRAQIEAQREKQYFTSRDEGNEGVSAIGIAGRVGGQLTALSIVGPTHRMDANMEQYVKVALEARAEFFEGRGPEALRAFPRGMPADRLSRIRGIPIGGGGLVGGCGAVALWFGAVVWCCGLVLWLGGGWTGSLWERVDGGSFEWFHYRGDGGDRPGAVLRDDAGGHGRGCDPVDRLTPGFLGGGGTVVDRGRRSIALDLKQPGAVDVVLRLLDGADALIEGFRPGVMERLGLGPDVCLARNRRLVYGRMTGWGQDGPLAQAAGHDLNYIALTGALHAMGEADRPPAPPLHLVGDMGGGAMMLAFGLLCALLEAGRSGQGQVVDAAICDGASLLATTYHGKLRDGDWVNRRQANMLDGGAHFYGCYACADGKYVSIGAIEPQFYRLLLERCGIDDPDFQRQWDRAQWPALRARLAALIAGKTRDEWCALLEGSDACFAPVLDFEEAPDHPQHRARASFVETDGIRHPAPAPRLSRTPGQARPIPQPGQHTEELLAGLGWSPSDIQALRERGAIA